MTIHFFTKGDKTVASSRYRVYFLADELNRTGHRAVVHQMELDWKRRGTLGRNTLSFFRYVQLFLSFKKSDAVFLQRTIYNKYFFLAVICARMLGRQFIFDFDDAIFKHSFFKAYVFVKMARTVTCGSHAALLWAKKYNPKSFFFPNPIPLEIYAPCTKDYEERDDSPVVGWVGSGPVHFENLKLLKSGSNAIS